MDKKAIEKIMENESLLERFIEVLIEEINDDDEAFYKKGTDGSNGRVDTGKPGKPGRILASAMRRWRNQKERDRLMPVPHVF